MFSGSNMCRVYDRFVAASWWFYFFYYLLLVKTPISFKIEKHK